MPGKIQPPGANLAQAYMIRLFMQTETDIIREITRKRGSGYVDYAEVAALERVQATLQKMVDDASVWTPKMIEHIFYHGKGTMAGYRNARSVAEPTPGRIRAIEQLSDNLMAMVTEMAGTAYQSAKEKVYSIGRLDPDQFAIEGMQSAAKAQAAGRGALTTISEFEKNLQEKGITAFVDKRGREWSLRDYGNMAVRTTSRQAQVAAVLTEDEHDLYQISSIGSTCPLCAVYEGRVYSKSGTDPHYPPLTMAFGKIDPAGGDDLSNSFLNIHPNCLHSLTKYTEKGKTEKQIQKMRDFSSFEKRPADVDPRTKKQREAYETKERNRARLRSEIKQFEKYTAAGVEGMPKTFATFQRHKQADDDKYREWAKAYRNREKGGD